MLCGAVGRTIIGDDELEIAKGLSDDGVERAGQKSLRALYNGIPMLTRGVSARGTRQSANWSYATIDLTLGNACISVTNAIYILQTRLYQATSRLPLSLNYRMGRRFAH